VLYTGEVKSKATGLARRDFILQRTIESLNNRILGLSHVSVLVSSHK
jgi:hypothetical protein